jgi:alcohol dehydrogenase/L-iditol 2-dehydrogenase
MSRIPAIVNFSPDPGSVEIREIKRPHPGRDEVLVKVKAVSVSDHDILQWSGRQTWPVRHPVVLGHEFCGIVAESPDTDGPWREGDRVVCDSVALIDPESPLSRSGLHHLDPKRKAFGSGVDGAMAGFVRVPERGLHRVPDNLRNEYAAMTEPSCVAYHAVIENSPIRPGCRVLVIGPGPIGLLCASMARLAGAEVAVNGLETDLNRLDIAELIGCHAICGDPTDWCRRGDGLGVDVVIDAAGEGPALKQALDLVRPAGWITKIGRDFQTPGVSLDPLVQKNITLRGSCSHHWSVREQVLELLGSGRLNLSPLLGGVWALNEWQTAFEAMRSGRIPKAVLTP